MSVHLLKKEILIPRSLEEVFDFFNRPENLEILTPPNLNFHILTPLPIKMREGALIDYRIRILGIQQRWTSMITHYDPPHSFVDEQLKGPYSFWHHRHEFLPQENGTLVKDEVRYALPLGILGSIVHQLIVKNQLKNIFDFRVNKMKELFP